MNDDAPGPQAEPGRPRVDYAVGVSSIVLACVLVVAGLIVNGDSAWRPALLIAGLLLAVAGMLMLIRSDSKQFTSPDDQAGPDELNGHYW